MASKYDLNVFAENLKYYMNLHEKTRKDLSDDLGISYYTISDWVNAKKFPRINTLETLADYFGVEKSDLLEKKEEKPIDEGLSDNKKKLMEFLESVPDNKVDYVIRIMQSILQDEE